jgi:exopolyphosphatase/guanosine-5'-triphosphate,3'-diphosphate pyrophosphatase
VCPEADGGSGGLDLAATVEKGLSAPRQPSGEGAAEVANPATDASEATQGYAASDPSRDGGKTAPKRRRRGRRARRQDEDAGQSKKSAIAHPRKSSAVRSATDALYAALDLGTNNCRLLIARRSAEGFKVVDAYSRIVRLGEGLARTGALSDAAMTRAIEALKICADKMARRGVTRTRTIATAACRTASNSDAFIERVKRETGLSLEIVSTEDEARLAVAGCAPLLDPRCSSALVFDIGGGSTELIWLRMQDGETRSRPVIGDWISLPCGVVTLAEHYGGVDVPVDLYERMVAEVGERLAPFLVRVRGMDAGQGGFHLLGTSGTVTTIAGVHLGLERYDRTRVDGIWISPADVHGVTQSLLGMSYGERAAHPCVGGERADLVLAGCAIFEAIARAWPAERLRVADRGLREGILMSLIEGDARRGRRRRRRRRRNAKRANDTAAQSAQVE